MKTTPVELWTHLLGALRADGMIAHAITSTGETTGAFIADLCNRLDTPALTEDEQRVVNLLCDVAYRADVAMDNSEDQDDNGHSVDRENFNALDDAVALLGELPDDQPGYVMGPAAKAGWALRRVLAERAHVGEAKPDYISVGACSTIYGFQAVRWSWDGTQYAIVSSNIVNGGYADALKAAARLAVELGLELRP